MKRYCQHHANCLALDYINAGATLYQKGKHGTWYGTAPNGNKMRIADHKGQSYFPNAIIFDQCKMRNLVRASNFWATFYTIHYHYLVETGRLNANRRLLNKAKAA